MMYIFIVIGKKLIHLACWVNDEHTHTELLAITLQFIKIAEKKIIYFNRLPSWECNNLTWGDLKLNSSERKKMKKKKFFSTEIIKNIFSLFLLICLAFWSRSVTIYSFKFFISHFFLLILPPSAFIVIQPLLLIVFFAVLCVVILHDGNSTKAI